MNESVQFTLSVRYDELDIDAAKFYFYLRKKFGKPNQQFSAAEKYFPKRKFVGHNEWCYLLSNGTDYLMVTGTDKISIAVSASADPPTKLDFDMFVSNVNKTLSAFDLREYNHQRYELYINYSFYLKNLISKYKASIQTSRTGPPEHMVLSHEEAMSERAEEKLKFMENARDYNQWLNQVIDKSLINLQIQILLPIHFESLVDLAFRTKLKKEYRNEKISQPDRKYPLRDKKVEIYLYFEKLDIFRKLEFIVQKCFHVNADRISDLKKEMEANAEPRKHRNRILHGNSILFKNVGERLYFDGKYVIGFPDRESALRLLVNSMNNSSQDHELVKSIKAYDRLCKMFVEVFDDNGYFKDLAESIAFAYNAEQGGTLSIGVKKYEDLFAPEDNDGKGREWQS